MLGRRTPFIISILVVVAVLVSVFAVVQLFDEVLESGSSGATRYDDYQLSDGLRQTSDDLTRMVRLYAATGDPIYREYYEEILNIRNGVSSRPKQYFSVPYWDIVLATGERPGDFGEAVPIRTLIRDAGFTDEQLDLLAAAEDWSNELTMLEFEVLETVQELREAGGDEYVLEGAALEALQRVHGQEYLLDKEMIMLPLVQLAHDIEESLVQIRANSLPLVERLINAVLVTIALIVLLTVAALYLRPREQQA